MQNKISSLPLPYQQMIGHRGVKGLAPENTAIGFKTAKRIGLNWVEFDTQPCFSGEWIVIHDETVDRTTNGIGEVHALTYKEIQQLDAGSFFDQKFKHEKVPLLSETLQLLNELSLHPNIEIKGKFKNNATVCKSFLNILLQYWPKTPFKPLPLISSFNLDLLIELRKQAPKLPIGYLVETEVLAALPIVLKYGFNSLHCDYKSPELSQLPGDNIHQIPVMAYTVNTQVDAQKLLALDIYALFSDYPNQVW